MTYKWDFSSIYTYRAVLMHGLGNTAQLAAASVACAVVLGLLLCLLRTSGNRLLAGLAAAVVSFFRNIPFLVQLFWLFYAMPVLTGLQTNPFMAAFIALSLYGGAYLTEIFRAGLIGVERGQWEAARAIGMGRGRILVDVILPQALRRVIPPFTTEVIELIKLTTVASSIAYAELLYSGKLVADQDFRPLESYTAVAVILLVVLGAVALVGTWCEARFKLEAH